MTNGIITSTLFEASFILKRFSEVKESLIQGKQFYSGTLSGIKTTLAICGVGKANAAHCAGLLMEKFNPDMVYNIGICGAYPASGLNIGDVVVADIEIYADEGLNIKDGFLSMNELFGKSADMEAFKIQNSFAMFIPDKLRNVRAGHFATVSTCTGILAKAREIESRLNAICENMEGAAVAHICSFLNIPVIEIRSVSNIIEDRTAEPLAKNYILVAAENAQKFFLERFV